MVSGRTISGGLLWLAAIALCGCVESETGTGSPAAMMTAASELGVAGAGPATVLPPVEVSLTVTDPLAAGTPSPGFEVLLSAPWGEAPGSFGMEDEAARPGPMSFAFDPAGRLVVIDTSNGRLQRFDSDGALHDILPLGDGIAEDLAIAPGGELYVLRYARSDMMAGSFDGYRILRFTSEGAAAGSFALAVPMPTALFADAVGVLVESRHGPLHRVAAHGVPLPPAEQLVPIANGRPDRSLVGRTWQAVKIGDSVRIVAHDADGTAGRKLRLEPSGTLLSLFSLDVDGSGNLFVGLYVEEQALVAVVRADEDEIVAVVALDPIRYTAATRFVAIRDDGRIVEMKTDRSGVTFVAYSWDHP